MTFVMIAFAAFSFSSCKSDDEEVPLESYIKGSWHSYKGVAKVAGKSETVDISKSGTYYFAYAEMDFHDGGQAIYHGYDLDSNGVPKWVVENVSYVTEGNTVTVTSPGGESISMVFDSKRNLCYQTTVTIGGTPIAVSIYMKK